MAITWYFRVIQGRVRIPNYTQDPIQHNRCADLAQIRRVLLPESSHQ